MNLEDIFESSNKPKQNLKVAGADDGQLEKFRKFVDILSGKKDFEGYPESPSKMKSVLDGIENLLNNDKAEATHSLKKGLVKLKPRIKKVRAIVSKIEKGEKLSKSDYKEYDNLAKAIEDIFFSETYMKDFAPQGEGGTSKSKMIYISENAFPISFKLDGKTYLGLVRPPTGIITWNGEAARKAAKKANIPLKLPLIGKNNNINKSKMIAELRKNIGLRYAESLMMRKKVRDLIIKHGGGEDKRGYPQYQEGLNKIGFWKDLEEIF
jgi:hypothetical protein